MTSISYKQLIDSGTRQLEVPASTEQMTVLQAAIAWASNGFYVLPIQSKTKHPGSVVGAGWPDKSSKDQETIQSWFSSSKYGLAIHVGKSGAIAFDVDEPKSLPITLSEWLAYEGTPFQSTRKGDSRRGHYLFATVPGASFGNSNGRLGQAWGEVRGQNGIIAVAPTLHQKCDEGGQYEWVRTGVLPYLPSEISRLLPENSNAAFASVDVEAVETFLSQHTRSELPELLNARIAEANRKLSLGSRHDNTRNLLLFCLRESMAGLYPAQECVEASARVFILHKPRSEWTSASEFIGMVRWAVAQVQDTSPEELAAIRGGALLGSSPAAISWLRSIA